MSKRAEQKAEWSADFREAVYTVTKMIPKGQVASYAQVATYVISPRYARAVGRALKELPRDRVDEVPWQRVINAAGRISCRGEVGRPILQEKLLKAEGIHFGPDGRTNLVVFGWSGPPEGWQPVLDDPNPTKHDWAVGDAPARRPATRRRR